MRHITTHLAPATGLRGIGDTSWHTRGVCHGMDPDDADATFFPLPRDHEATAEAKELCGPCPVRRDCLTYALENALKEGIWGGLTELERKPWHDGLSHRLDYSRVVAFFNGRDVHLTEAERQIAIDHAYVCGWRADRLAIALQIGRKHARDLLKQAANRISDRDRTQGVPPSCAKRNAKKKVQAAQTGSRPLAAEPGAQQPTCPPMISTPVRASAGKAA
ncbi:WhiB family transcriptional regulator [Streptomyces sp. NPDC001443]